MVAASVAVALIIVIIGMMAYRHQRMRDSEYIYKYVKLAANRTAARPAAKSRKEERNLLERIREVLAKDRAFLNANIDYGQLEHALVLKRRTINRQLTDNYQTSLKEIVTDMRLEYACELLENTITCWSSLPRRPLSAHPALSIVPSKISITSRPRNTASCLRRARTAPAKDC